VNPSLLFDAAALLAGAVGAVWDARTGRIPNWLTLPVAGAAVTLHLAVGGFARGAESVVGLLVAGFVPWVFARATRGRAIGGGDVKLFAALGALQGPVAGLEIELSACVLVATFAVVRLAFAGKLLRVLASAFHLLVSPLLPRRFRRPPTEEALTEMRMGPAICAAVCYSCTADQLARWVPWLAV
jgi:prepilin peptidase CpaA